jgi:hypothetical protein
MKDQKKRAVKTRPFGREVGILSEKRAKCVIFKRNMCQQAPEGQPKLVHAVRKAQWTLL